ncbi:pilus assembly protein N-terminal domain-containing protein [Melittangium boletus]|uniref:Pilus formation protein N-terminal domain-containing protein n=1 Tax=Melittangium boletus DSM 14713 TaxID=1294270 RepID=A0A250IPN1_9BACT|nr:pilus assembly protein N-terminal domain-containing protein [Melittangium boletus]ATB33228.1 hypothetical protein MEBOL_006717 [Melittangium boletus DSM 14713]
MDVKKQLGRVAVLAVVMAGTAAGAEQSAPVPKKALAIPSETITLKRGETKKLESKDAIGSSIQDPEILNVSVPGDSAKTVFHMTGEKVGKTTFTVWSKDGKRRTYEIIVKE